MAQNFNKILNLQNPTPARTQIPPPSTTIPQWTQRVHPIHRPAQSVQIPPRPTLIPSQGAQNQFFVFGNLIMSKAEDDSYLKMDLKRTRKEVKELNASLNALAHDHDDLQDRFDEKTDAIEDIMNGMTIRLYEMEKGKGLVKKLEELLESEKKQKK